MLSAIGRRKEKINYGTCDELCRYQNVSYKVGGDNKNL